MPAAALLVTLSALLVALSLSGLLLAQAPAALTWEVPLACPAPDRFHALVDAYLGRAVDAREAALDIDVTISTTSTGAWALDLTLTHADLDLTRRHHIEGSDCDALVRQAAAITAIHVDPFARGPDRELMSELAILVQADPGSALQRLGSASSEPPSRPDPSAPIDEPAPASTQGPELEPAPTQEPELEPTPTQEPELEPTPTLRGFVSASGAARFNLFEGATPGVHGQLGLEHGLWRAAIQGGAAFGRFRSAGDPTLGAQLIGWSLGLRGCVVPRWGRVSLRGCVSAGAGQVQARGVGVSNPQRVAEPWIWLAPELGVGVSLGAVVGLFVDLGPAFSVLRPSFRIDSPAVLFELPVTAAVGRVGIELRFPRRGT